MNTVIHEFTERSPEYKLLKLMLVETQNCESTGILNLSNTNFHSDIIIIL